MNERIEELAKECNILGEKEFAGKIVGFNYGKFAELILEDMHRKVIASILITDVVIEEKGLAPTSEDYIQAINKDFGVE